MKKLFAVMGACVLATSFANAQDGFYLGPSMSYYHLDSGRSISGHNESTLLGLNMGYRLDNNWAIEAGYGHDIGGDDMEIGSLSALYWFGEDSKSWRPYAIGGYTYYDLDDDNNLQQHEGHSDQLHLGVGMGKMITDHLELRGDVRALQKISGGNEGQTDVAVNLALNYFFRDPAAAIVPAVAAAAIPAPEPAAEPAPAPEMRTITVPIKVLFETDKDVVRAVYGDELQAVANAMKAHDDITLVLGGHTDSRGTAAYNQDLSERRVKNVKARIVKDYGIDPSRIEAIGYGESKPIATNMNAAGRAKNRRVVGEVTFTEVVE